MSIKVENITKLYGKQKALNSVSVNINSGEIVGLLGTNGAGKSTLMKIITCFIPPSSGNVSVCGYDIFEQSMEVRKKVGYLPEHNPLYLDMYVREYLEFLAGIHHLNKKAKIEEMIDITGLGIEQNKKIGALSKGYRQRIGLAQALIHDPEVLILDEPTSGLDPNQLLEIRNLIKMIGKEKTVMLSTHIMQEVEAVCDRVIIINKGEIVADNSTENIHKLAVSKNIITVEFDKNIEINLIENLNDVKTVKSIGENSWEIQTSADVDIRQNIFQFAVKNSLAVLSMNKQSQSLEEIFQQLTKGK